MTSSASSRRTWGLPCRAAARQPGRGRHRSAGRFIWSAAYAVQEGQRIINGMQDILRLFLSRTFYVALIILSTSILGGFPFSPKQSSIVALMAVGIPTLALAAWARPGPIYKGSLERHMLRFVLPASLTMAILGLLVYAGFMAVGRQEYLLTNPPATTQAIFRAVQPMAQTAFNQLQHSVRLAADRVC